ncbi:HigA family addiction module antitoxin [Sedimenticola hydrogenitrophicus]|uniref:HigA family addiction module antitoxin n=1 Tax=Sedimenticola hydrogenitrophicus TaxID=2967975 RepID=UPI0021A52320|nr:HigA family addiction module antitoxin [Sedimenticola hydrogenitrophicus]
MTYESPDLLVHPGEILQTEFLEELNLSAYKLAQDISVPRTRISDIIAGKRAITADTALRLGRYFGTTAQFWMNLQADYDLRKAVIELGEKLEQEVHPRAA